jgi:hypothetical protein
MVLLIQLIIVALIVWYGTRLFSENRCTVHTRILEAREEVEKRKLRIAELKSQRRVYEQERSMRYNNCSGSGFFTVVGAVLLGMIIGG